MNDVEVALQLDGAWVNAASQANYGLYARDAVSVSYGRSNWASRVDTGLAGFTLDNRDGRWSPDYASGLYYGSYKRNIPVRIGVGRGDRYLGDTGLSKDLASTPDISGGGGGSPTTPVVASITTSSETSFVTSHDFTMPATVNVGDRLLLIAAFGHDSAVHTSDFDPWTVLYSLSLHGFHRWVVYELNVNSTALASSLAGAVMQFTTTNAVKSSGQVYRVTGVRSGGSGVSWAVSAGTGAQFGTAPNSVSLTAPWGASQNLFISMFTAGSTGATVSANPTGYTAGASGNASAGVIVGSAYKASSSATDDPAAFTINDPENWDALTLVYQPVEVTNTDGVLDISGDIDLRIEFQLHQDLVDIVHGGTRARLAHKSSGANGWELELYNALGSVVSNFQWYDGSGVLHSVTTEATGDALPLSFQHGRSALRVTLDVNNGAGGHTVTWYHAPTITSTWTQLGSTVITSGTTAIKTNDAPLRIGGNPGDSAFYTELHGKLYAFEMRNGIGGTAVANPSFKALAVGTTSFTDAAGRTWTVGAGGRVTNQWWRFHGELASLPVRWDVSGKDVWAPVQASGLFRRLRQGNRRLESALRRAIIRSGAGVIQYWPMEETGGGYITRFGAAVGTAPLETSLDVPDTGANSSFLCSSALPTLGGTALTATVDTYAATGQWQVRWLQFIPLDFAGDGFHFMRVETSDMVWEVEYRDDSGGQLNIHAYRGFTEVYTSGYLAFNANGKAWRMTLAIKQNGSSVDVALLGQEQDGTSGGISTASAVVGSAGVVNRILINKDANVGDWAFGHLSLQNVVTDSSELAVELNAHQGEKAGDRIVRLCREEGIATRIEGDPAATEAMGPQLSGTLMSLLEECAITDLGILHEARDSVAVGYRTRTSMLDQGAKIALNYADGEVARSPELDRDDQDFANDVEVENWTGATARAVLDDGSDLSVSEPPVGAGRYDQTFKVNGQDSRLPALAATRLALSAVNEPRVSKLSLALHHPAVNVDPILVESILDASLGDLVTIDDPLAVALGATQVRQLLQGTRDSIGPIEHYIDALTSPASPWESGDVAPPPAPHSVTFRSQKKLATASTPPHVLTALGYTGSTNITRAELDGILDDWVASTGGTTRNVTSSGTWTTAMANAVPGDLIRVTSGFTADIAARGNRYVNDPNMTASPAGGQPGLPIILTCADGVSVTGSSTSSNVAVLDIRSTTHVWAVGFNTIGGQFGIRAMNWGGTEGFPAYRAYCNVSGTGHSGLIAQGWFQLITLSGGTPPPGSGNEWGFSSWFVDEENFVDNVGLISDAFGECYYYGRGSAPGWVSYCKDFWHRGNEGKRFRADGIDLKPGCHRYRVTDNRYHGGYCVFGAPMTINYCSSDIDARPAWVPADVEGYMEGNRVWDINLSLSNGSSANIGAYCGLSGQRWVNNLFWGILQTGFTGGIYIRNEKGTDDTTAVATFGTAPTLFLNNLYWGTTGAVVKGGYGAGAGFPDPYPGSVVFTERNNVAAGATGAQFVADSADFIATVPSVGATGDAEWLTYGAGSAFDLADASDLVAAGVSINDLTRLIAEDISQRTFASPPNPGPFQPYA